MIARVADRERSQAETDQIQRQPPDCRGGGARSLAHQDLNRGSK